MNGFKFQSKRVPVEQAPASSVLSGENARHPRRSVNLNVAIGSFPLRISQTHTLSSSVHVYGLQARYRPHTDNANALISFSCHHFGCGSDSTSLSSWKSHKSIVLYSNAGKWHHIRNGSGENAKKSKPSSLEN